MKIFDLIDRRSLLNPMVKFPRGFQEATILSKRGCFNKSCARTASRGFTLIELVVFMVAASVMIGGILYPFVSGVRDFEKPDEMLWAINLAQSVMEKYSHVAFTDEDYLTPTSGTSITDITFPAGYTGMKSIKYVDPDDPNLNESATATPYKRIEIVITTPSSRAVSLQGVVSDWSYE